MKRILTKWDSVAIGLGIVIGVGIFRVPADVARLLPQGGLIFLLAWLVGGVISFVGALCYAELATLFAETGGDYVFIREAYGKALAFAYAWTDLTIIRTGNIAALSFLFADYAPRLLCIDQSQARLLAIGVVLILASLNLLGIDWGRKVQNTFTLAKVAALLLLIACGFLDSNGQIGRVAALPSGSLDAKAISSFGLAMIPILWTYGGWHENTFVAGETKDAQRSLPFSLLTTVLVVSFIYILANGIFLYGFSTEQMANSPLIAADMLNRKFGLSGSRLLAGLISVYSICTINAMIITGSRITYAVSSDVPALKPFAATTKTNKTPAAAVLLVSSVACIFILLGSFDRLLFFTGNVVWLFFALIVTTLFVFRKRNIRTDNQFLVPGYPILPAIFVLVCLGLSLNTWLTYPWQSACGVALAAGGIPLYFILKFLEKKFARQPNE